MTKHLHDAMNKAKIVGLKTFVAYWYIQQNVDH